MHIYSCVHCYGHCLDVCPLLSAYFPAVSCYKRMCLTTSAYGIVDLTQVCYPLQPKPQWSDLYWSHSSGQSTAA